MVNAQNIGSIVLRENVAGLGLAKSSKERSYMQNIPEQRLIVVFGENSRDCE
jgi:hypothetical protein